MLLPADRLAHRDAVERLSAAVAAAARGKSDGPSQLSAALAAGLDFLATDPASSRLLLVEAPASARPEHERALGRLARELSGSSPGWCDGQAINEERARILVGGLVFHLSGRVLAGEAERLPESRDLLFRYLRNAGARSGESG